MSTLIAGGGVAGAAAAILVGQGATVVERERGAHDKICGEFISWEARAMLAGLGVDVGALGGVAIHSVRLAHGGRVVTAGLPGEGVSLSRRVLDEALLGEAGRRGAVVLRGHAVRGASARCLEVAGVGRLEGERVLLATGKHSLRGVARGVAGEPLVGLKMYFRLGAEAAAGVTGHVEVVLFPGGYAGLQMVEGGRANLCLLIGKRAFDEVGGDWAGVVAHLVRHSGHLAGRLAGAEALLERPLTIYRVPYGFVYGGGEGVRRLGDQMAVIPSFSGDGMAIALHTAMAAVGGDEAAAYHARMRRELGGQVGRAMVLHRGGLAAPGWVAGVARAWPSALSWVARLTRVRGVGV